MENRVWVREGVQEDVRSDGRGGGEYRRAVLETGLLAGSAGSSRVDYSENANNPVVVLRARHAQMRHSCGMMGKVTVQ